MLASGILYLRVNIGASPAFEFLGERLSSVSESWLNSYSRAGKGACGGLDSCTDYPLERSSSGNRSSAGAKAQGEAQG